MIICSHKWGKMYLNFMKFIRFQYWQLKLTAGERKTPKKILTQIKVPRTMRLQTPLKRTKDAPVWAISIVKNEIDILPAVIDHLLEQGVDRLLIADNNSTDGTLEYLIAQSNANPKILVARDANPVHSQSEKMSYLSFLASVHGAQWIVPFDGDEFWYGSRNTLAETLKNSPEHVLYAGFHHAVPTREAPADIRDAELMMDSADSFPGKVAFRSHPLAVIIPGNHDVARAGARARKLDIVHVQYRSVEQIKKKFHQGISSASKTGENLTWFAPHWQAGSSLSIDELYSVWNNISSGQPDSRIQYKAEGPMIKGKFLKMKYWNIDECK